MEGLYSRRREKFRLDYLKERGGLLRIVQMMILGAVLGFLGLSPGADAVTSHIVMTSFVLTTVTLVLLAHLLGHRRRFCFSSAKSWAIVVLTLFGLLALVVQAVENFQRARGYTVPSRLTEPVPIYTRLMMGSLRPPGDTRIQTTTTMVETRPSSPGSPSLARVKTTPNVTQVEEEGSAAGALESAEITEASPFIVPRVVASSATTPADASFQLTPSIPGFLQVPQRTPGGAQSPVAFLTPYETPSAIPTLSSYRTPAGPLPTTTGPTPSSSYSASRGSPQGNPDP